MLRAVLFFLYHVDDDDDDDDDYDDDDESTTDCSLLTVHFFRNEKRETQKQWNIITCYSFLYGDFKFISLK